MQGQLRSRRAGACGGLTVGHTRVRASRSRAERAGSRLGAGSSSSSSSPPPPLHGGYVKSGGVRLPMQAAVILGVSRFCPFKSWASRGAARSFRPRRPAADLGARPISSAHRTGGTKPAWLAGVDWTVSFFSPEKIAAGFQSSLRRRKRELRASTRECGRPGRSLAAE
jgi:hypothetical protein